jgi:hypothetical protein
MWPRSAALIGTLALAAAAALWGQSANPPKPASSPQNSLEDLPAGPLQSKAATACMECHDARIILQQRLNKGAWTREVDKMVKWGALVDASDRDALIDYLNANFGPDRPPYQAPRLAPTKPQSRASKK